jgi:hypothetical protein
VHAGAVGLEDGMGRLPDPGPECDFRTGRLVEEAKEKGEGMRKEQRKQRQEKATAAFVNKQAEYQVIVSVFILACILKLTACTWYERRDVFFLWQVVEALLFLFTHPPVQANCSAAMVAVMDSGAYDGYKKIGN